MSSVEDDAAQMDSWDGPAGPLLKTRSGLSSLATAFSDADEHYERSRKTSTQTRGVNAKSRKPKEPTQYYLPYKTAETTLASPHGMARRGSITTLFSRINSAGGFFPSLSFSEALSLLCAQSFPRAPGGARPVASHPTKPVWFVRCRARWKRLRPWARAVPSLKDGNPLT